MTAELSASKSKSSWASHAGVSGITLNTQSLLGWDPAMDGPASCICCCSGEIVFGHAGGYAWSVVAASGERGSVRTSAKAGWWWLGCCCIGMLEGTFRAWELS
jgi:hypothetical protein